MNIKSVKKTSQKLKEQNNPTTEDIFFTKKCQELLSVFNNKNDKVKDDKAENILNFFSEQICFSGEKFIFNNAKKELRFNSSNASRELDSIVLFNFFTDFFAEGFKEKEKSLVFVSDEDIESEYGYENQLIGLIKNQDSDLLCIDIKCDFGGYCDENYDGDLSIRLKIMSQFEYDKKVTEKIKSLAQRGLKLKDYDILLNNVSEKYKSKIYPIFTESLKTQAPTLFAIFEKELLKASIVKDELTTNGKKVKI
jgi:hypothetical protein